MLGTACRKYRNEDMIIFAKNGPDCVETSLRLVQHGHVGLPSMFSPSSKVSATQAPQIPTLAQLGDCFPVFAGKEPPSGGDGAHEAHYTLNAGTFYDGIGSKHEAYGANLGFNWKF